MARQCEICGKRARVGNRVSHSNIKSKRRFHPNLQEVRHQWSNGRVESIRICTRCLRSGAVVKPAARKS
jgi:large subunit ribosomal protein L28